LPRLCILLVSLCQTFATRGRQPRLFRLTQLHEKACSLTPAVAVFMPVPSPATILPTIIYQDISNVSIRWSR
jgi:hypothetical protein